MSNYDDLVNELGRFSGHENIISISRPFAEFMGSLQDGAILSQMVFWSDKGRANDGWFYKTYDEWREELVVTKYAVSTLSKKLVKLGLLETKVKKVKGTPTVHYKLDAVGVKLSIVRFLTFDNSDFNFLLKTDPTEDKSKNKSRDAGTSLASDPVSPVEENTVKDEHLSQQPPPLQPGLPVIQGPPPPSVQPSLIDEGPQAGDKSSRKDVIEPLVSAFLEVTGIDQLDLPKGATWGTQWATPLGNLHYRLQVKKYPDSSGTNLRKTYRYDEKITAQAIWVLKKAVEEHGDLTLKSPSSVAYTFHDIINKVAATVKAPATVSKTGGVHV